MVTIFDSTDLSFAIQCSRILKLQVLINSEIKNEVEGITQTEVTNLKKQIRTIRDQVNKLLDFLDNIKPVKNIPTLQGMYFYYILYIYL